MSELPTTKVSWLLPASQTEFLISTGVHSCGSHSNMFEHNPVSALRSDWYMFILVIRPLPNSNIEFYCNICYFKFAFIPHLKSVGFLAHIP